MRSPRSLGAALLLLLTGAVFAALAAWTMVSRSTIPIALDGRVTAVEVRHEKHPGVDDVWMVSVDSGRPRHVDRAVATLLREGSRIRKDAWDTGLSVDGVTHRVELGDDARSMLVLAPVMTVAFGALVVVASWPRRRSDAGP